MLFLLASVVALLSDQPTDRAIVEFREPQRLNIQQRRQTLENDLEQIDRNASIEHVRFVYRHVFNGAEVSIPRAKWNELAKLPYVKAIHPVQTMHAMQSANITQVGAPAIWSAKGNRGSGIVIAIIDTGIDYTHPALGGCFGPGCKVKGGWDFVNNDADPRDDNGHGTHVAGIAAANSSTIVGVAPDASLMAFKVLDSKGSGEGGALIAALDHAVDPNGDGDTSDHVDVVNLSLGGVGSSDDPVAQAVENAISKGVVVVCAAGNDGDFFRIGSPGSSPHAITVGASELAGTVAFFSSRGPSTGAYAIKPEVVAPGVGIVSTWPGGGTQTENGTSMASPHVAGAAALLRAIHPDWTPADVKSALVSTAVDLKDEVMSEGAGRIDLTKAVDATVFLDPPAFGYGLADVAHDMWSPSMPVRITNRGTAPVTIADVVTVTPGPAVPQWGSIASTSIGAGQSKDITLAMTVDHRASPFPTQGSLSYSGVIQLAGVNARFAFVKASRVRITTDEGSPLGFVSDDHQMYRVLNTGTNVAESIVPAGTYDAVTWISFPDEGRLAVREKIDVKGTADVMIAASSLTNTITMGGVDDEGVLLSTRSRVNNTSIYKTRLRLTYPAGNLLHYFDSAFLDVSRFRTNDIPARWRVLIAEIYADAPSASLYVVQHPVLDGVTQSTALQGETLHQQEVHVVAPADGENHQIELATARHDRYPDRTVFDPTVHVRANGTVAHLFITPDVDPVYGYPAAVGMKSPSNQLEDFEPVPIRLFADGRVTTAPGATAGPAALWHQPGEIITLGGAPIHPRIEFTPLSPTAEHTFFLYYGANGERRDRDVFSTKWATFDSAGNPITSGGLESGNLVTQFSAPGVVRLEFTNPVAGKSTYRAWIDTTNADAIAPALSGLSIENGTLKFGVLDQQFTVNGREYKPIPTDKTRVDYKVSGSIAWLAAAPRLLVDDQIVFPAGRTSDGAVYTCAIPAMTTGTSVDIRITAEDSAGNRMEYTLEPAFTVQATSPSRRRTVHH